MNKQNKINSKHLKKFMVLCFIRGYSIEKTVLLCKLLLGV